MAKVGGLRIWKRLFILLLAATVVLIAAGAGYQSVSARLDRKSFPAPGRMVDIGDGRQLHLHCAGEGQPTVILEAASDMFSSDWHWVQQELAAVTKVCAYDRAGLGWSDPAAGSRDANQLTGELRALMEKSGLTPPLLMVGHSLGGLLVQVYAARYPETVAGLVLLDPGNEYFFERIPRLEEQTHQDKRTVAMLELASHIGLLRLADIGSMNADGLPEKQVGEVARFVSLARHWAMIGDLIDALPDTYAIVRQAELPVHLPMTVISAGTAWLAPNSPRDEIRAAVNELHAETAARYAAGRHMVIEEASHGSLVHNREHARIVAGAIAERIDSVRSAVAPASLR